MVIVWFIVILIVVFIGHKPTTMGIWWCFVTNNTGWCSRLIAKLVQITPITMVYTWYIMIHLQSMGLNIYIYIYIWLVVLTPLKKWIHQWDWDYCIPYIMEKLFKNTNKCLYPQGLDVLPWFAPSFYHVLPHHFCTFSYVYHFYHLFGAEGLASLKIKRMKPPSCKTEDMLLFSRNILQCNWEFCVFPCVLSN